MAKIKSGFTGERIIVLPDSIIDEFKNTDLGKYLSNMRENVRKNLTLKEISGYVGFSASHFSGIFQRKTGHSPLNYLIHIKIQEAYHYLYFPA